MNKIFICPVKDSLLNCGFNDHVLFYDLYNQIAIEFHAHSIRIDGFCYSDGSIFSRMLQHLIEIGKNLQIDVIQFADEISEEAKRIFIRNGFVEKEVEMTSRLTFLYLDLK